MVWIPLQNLLIDFRSRLNIAGTLKTKAPLDLSIGLMHIRQITTSWTVTESPSPKPRVDARLHFQGQDPRLGYAHDALIHCPSKVEAFSRRTPLIKNTLLRDNFPLINSTLFFATPNVSATKPTSAMFAFPSTGGACTAIFNCVAFPSPYTPTIAVLFAPGCALTASVTPPATARIIPAPSTAAASRTAPSPRGSASRPRQSPAQNLRSSPSTIRRISSPDAPPPSDPATPLGCESKPASHPPPRPTAQSSSALAPPDVPSPAAAPP